MTDNDVRERIRAYIVENFLYTRRDFAFGDDDSLLRRGIFDSLGVMEIIGFIEDTWHIRVPPEAIVEENFGSIAGMARYVAGNV